MEKLKRYTAGVATRSGRTYCLSSDVSALEARGEELEELHVNDEESIRALGRSFDNVRTKLQAAEKALVEAAIPLEVLAAQIRLKPYKEMTLNFQNRICETIISTRAALAEIRKGDEG